MSESLVALLQENQCRLDCRTELCSLGTVNFNYAFTCHIISVLYEERIGAEACSVDKAFTL